MKSSRPPYPEELFDVLEDLITTDNKSVLDIGCGDGNLARRLMRRVDSIDAVDFSKAMIDQGKTLQGGDHPDLHWIHGLVEEVTLSPPYSLVTAGQSLHWMDWDVVFPRFQKLLTPDGYLAIVSNKASTNEWDTQLGYIIQQTSTNKDFQPYDIVAELQIRGLFDLIGEKETAPMPFTQSIDAYVESWHSRNGLSRERISQEAAEAFDDQVRALVSRYSQSDTFEMQFTGRVVWGMPKNTLNDNWV